MSKPILGILGAGKLGTTLARLAVSAGYPVLIAGSGSVKKIALTIEVLVPGAQAATAHEVTTKAELILLALPLGKYHTLNQKNLAGKIVLDAMNYWWEVDGRENTISDLVHSSSEVVATYLAESYVAKVFNHMGYHDIESEARAAEQPDRKAIAYATDHKEAGEAAEQLIDDLGFDPLLIGALHKGIMLEPGSPLFGADLTKTDLQQAINDFPKSDFGQKVYKAKIKSA